MFQKALFKSQLEKLLHESTTTEFSERTGFNRTYLSKYLNLKLDRPPSPHLLKSIAGPTVPYEELMVSCGYLDPSCFSCDKAVKIPVVSAIHTGNPTFSMKEIIGYEYVDSSELSDTESYFYFKMEGDSMMNARIYAGDLVFIRKQSHIANGDIAVVSIDMKDATLKRILKKDSLIILQPENSAFQCDVFLESESYRLQIIGKVVHVKFAL